MPHLQQAGLQGRLAVRPAGVRLQLAPTQRLWLKGRSCLRGAPAAAGAPASEPGAAGRLPAEVAPGCSALAWACSGVAAVAGSLEGLGGEVGLASPAAAQLEGALEASVLAGLRLHSRCG